MGGLEGSKKSWRLETRASEAKGPFPGGKRVGSWGKKKNKRKEKASWCKKKREEGWELGGKKSKRK